MLDQVGGNVQNLHRARVQLAAVFVQEEGQGHAPAALARDAPVGPASDHVAQAGFAVFGVKRRFFNRIQGQLTQRFGRFVFGEHAIALVHADKPLGCGAVNHRGFVAPAMWVAVGDIKGTHQATRLAQGLDDDRTGFPDVLAAKQGQLGFIRTVALHRVQDIVIGHAMRDAGVEIFYAISRGGVNQAGAVVCGGVVGQIDRAQAVIARVHMGQGVLKVQTAQVFAHRGGHDGAGELVTLHALFNQTLGQHQKAALGVHQRVGQLRVQVECLVGGNRPGGGGPDDGKGVFAERVQAKGGSQFVGLGA